MIALPPPPPAIVEAARATSDPLLMLAISYVESNWRTNAIGKAGEIGALQLHPKYHKVPNELTGQFKYADSYLRKLQTACGDLYIACYNAGPKNALDKGYGLNYNKKVLEVYRVLKKDKIIRGTDPSSKGKVCKPTDDHKGCKINQRREFARPLQPRRQPDLRKS